MIFARTSHTLMFVGGILLLVAFVADEQGALGTVATEAQGAQLSPGDQDQLAAQEAAAAETGAMVVEEVDGWEDDPEFDDLASMPDMDPDPDPVVPDNSGDDIYDPDAGVFSPEPDGDDW